MAKNFFQKLSQTMTDTGRDMANEGKKFAEITKLNSMINNRKKREQECYSELGRGYFNISAHYQIPELEERVNEIREILNDIEMYQKKILDLKGVTICKSCGAEVGIHELFCSACGARNEDAKPEEEGLFCPVCHTPLNENDSFCINCGHKIEKPEQIPQKEEEVPEDKVCPACGAVNIGQNRFCRECGFRLDQQPAKDSILKSSVQESEVPETEPEIPEPERDVTEKEAYEAEEEEREAVAEESSGMDLW
ncbi:MAG: zinc ribbon domain-containing protein [Candidatus Choladocola sp.]|nr:zinc ribbon domain-containing protein [Candidatus Choladocola sp.]